MSANSRLDGILKWSLSQSDGTGPARQITDEDRQWFQEAVGSHLVDIVGRMKEIAAVMAVGEEALTRQGVTEAELAGLLEELQEHVESIDMANDLKAIGGLDPLLAFLRSPHALLRARAAEVLTTMVQNNEKSQRNVTHAGGLVLLCDLYLRDPDTMVRTKALGAISSLIRHNADGLQSFRAICGVKALVASAASEDPKLRRKSLNLLKYVLEEHKSDRQTCIADGACKLLAGLLQDPEEDIRTSAASVLLEIAQSWPNGDPQKDGVVALVRARVAEIASLGEGEREDLAEEEQGLKTLEKKLEEGGTVEARPSVTALALGPPQ